MKEKIKQYTIMLSQVFPTTHVRAGEPTQFIEAFIAGQGCSACPNNPWCGSQNEGCVVLFKKLHTIRANYPLWKKRIEAVQKGEAVINIRVWNGKPYRSKTTLIYTLTAKDGVGLQALEFKTDDRGESVALIDGICMPSQRVLANNDGLCLIDWQEWFKGYDLSKPLAIIQFTEFRYNQVRQQPTQQDLFDGEGYVEPEKPTVFCRTCAHRLRVTADWSNSVWQYCEVRKSKRTQNGLLKIKAKNPACQLYKPQEKGGQE